MGNSLVTVRMPDELIKDIDEHRESINRSAFIRAACRKELTLRARTGKAPLERLIGKVRAEGTDEL